MTTPVFELKGVSAGYGDVQILNDVSIQVPANSIVTIVGPNGAGKSTILKSIYGIAKVTAGEIKLHKLSGESIDVRATKPHHLADIGIAYVPQIENIFPTLTVDENLDVGYKSNGGTPLAERKEKIRSFARDFSSSRRAPPNAASKP